MESLCTPIYATMNVLKFLRVEDQRPKPSPQIIFALLDLTVSNSAYFQVCAASFLVLKPQTTDSTIAYL